LWGVPHDDDHLDATADPVPLEARFLVRADEPSKS
jgi:hypothetical protein